MQPELTAALTLAQVNEASLPEATHMLDGLYEHSPWVADAALAMRPFRSVAHLKQLMAQTVDSAGLDAQLALIRAHPELAGQAMVSQTLTAESTLEQNTAGLTQCTPQELQTISQLNAQYAAKFGFPFVLAVRGPRGTGLNKQQIIDTFERRLQHHPDFERHECLRNIHRIVELRLNAKFGLVPDKGHAVWDWLEKLAQFSDPGFAEKGQLAVTYLTAAHQACAQMLQADMLACGFDSAEIDALGNVVGRYKAQQAGARTLMTGSHFDTVRNAGKHDGRLGIYVPIACVKELAQRGERLAFDLEVVGFAEEEGQRYKATFLGSGGLTGAFEPNWLAQQDADGVTMQQAMLAAGHPATLEAIAAVQRNPGDYLGFIEVHIEQGPVLNELGLPLGIVTSINGSVRYACDIIGMASHAGTTPMGKRYDAALAAAELALFAEQRAGQDSGSVATVGQWQVPNGSTNVVPGRCLFTLDMRAPNNAQRDALVTDIQTGLKAICDRRGVRFDMQETMRAAAAPSDAAWQQRWERAVNAMGVTLYRMTSGAGHDAMKLHEVMPQAMLFVRGQNAGISHNPLESTTSDDIQLAVEALSILLQDLSSDLAPTAGPAPSMASPTFA